MNSKAPLTEPIAVPDVFASGVASIENVGDNNFRVTCFVHQRCVHGASRSGSSSRER